MLWVIAAELAILIWLGWSHSVESTALLRVIAKNLIAIEERTP